MASQISSPRGMRDFLPADKRRRERVMGLIREAFAAHGFDEIETPVVEDAERLHSGMGGDNEKLSFAVMRRGLGRDELQHAADANDPLALSDLGLRYDLTVPLARFIATHRGTLPTVFRSLQIGPVWRAERPQKGRYRQFVQCDVDISGEPGLLAEIELLAAGSAALVSLGLRSCTIRVNDRRLLAAILDACGFDAAAQPGALISIDKLDKIGPDGVIAELHGAAADDDRAREAADRLGEALAAWAPRLATGIPLEAAEMLAALPETARESLAVREAIDSLVLIAEGVAAAGGGLPLVFDPTLVRGMGYYTGTIFEVAHPDSGSSVGGGGRYDGMIGRFLGQDVPAAGFSIGFERVIDLVSDDALRDDGAQSGIVLLVDKRMPARDVATVKAAWLAPGVRVRVERRPKNPRTLLESLAEQGWTHVGHVRDEHLADPRSLELQPLTGDDR